MPVRGGRRGDRMGARVGPGGGLEGKCRSSVDAREPQNPTKRETPKGPNSELLLCCTVHEGHKRPKR
eukprot:1191939-Prorocentrum_minimum.AAC.4